MTMTIEYLPESRIAYFRNVGEYGEKQNKQLMEAFKKWAQLHDLLNDSIILGIPQDNPNVTRKEECRYDVCVLITEDFQVVEPAQVGQFSGGKYAVFALDHTKEAINEFWQTIFAEIKKNQLLVRDQPIVERYTSHMINNHLCEILVPIE